MKDYDEILKRIPQQAWQYLEAEYEEAENGEGLIQFFWDDEEHPELAPLNELDDDQWNDFVITALNRSLDNELAAISEPGNRDDGEGGELDQESDSEVPS